MKIDNKGLFNIIFVISQLLLISQNAWAEASNDYKIITSEKKKFTINKKYLYKERVYLNSEITWINNRIFGNEGPDRELVSLLSAMKTGDYRWWISIWDEKSQFFYKKLDVDKNKTNRIIGWKEVFDKSDFHLGRWIETREFVILTYNVMNENNIEEKAIPFHLEDGRWKATLYYPESAFVELLLNKKDSSSITVR